jgi:hypothetical protein
MGRVLRCLNTGCGSVELNEVENNKGKYRCHKCKAINDYNAREVSGAAKFWALSGFRMFTVFVFSVVSLALNGELPDGIFDVFDGHSDA